MDLNQNYFTCNLSASNSIDSRPRPKDLVSIINVFCTKLNEMRKYKNK